MNSSSSGGLVPCDPWEQEGSDLLPGGHGNATVLPPLWTLDLLVLAIKMACNSLRLECPIGNGRLQQSLLKKTCGTVDEVLRLANVFIQIVMKEDVAIIQETAAGSPQSSHNSEPNISSFLVALGGN